MKRDYYRIGSTLAWFTAVIFFIFGLYLFTYFDENFRPVVAMICTASLIGVDVLYRQSKLKTMLNNQLFGMAELISSILLSLNGIGALGLYLQVQYYDMALHVVGPIGVGMVITLLMVAYRINTKPVRSRTIQLTSLVVTFVGIFAWELYEWSGDKLFGTMMFGQPGETYDTLYDILGGIGSLAVLALINGLILRRHGSTQHSRN